MKKLTIISFLTICFTFLFSIKLMTNVYAIEIDSPAIITPVSTPKYNPIKSIKLNQKKIRLNKGDKRYLTITIKYGKKKNRKNEPYMWYSSNPKVATVNKNGVITGLSKGVTYISFKGMESKVKTKCKVTVTKTKYVAFTFDDGPGKYTNELLNALNKYNSKATFFLLGNNVKYYKKTVKKAYDSGMEIGSHSSAHANLNTLSKNKVKKDLTNASNAIKNVIGCTPTLFRPPYGNYNKNVQEYANAPMIYWTVDFEDWNHKNTKYVYKKILKQAKDGEIVLLHDIHKTTVKGFKKALPKLRKRGFELVTVSELYKIKGINLADGKMHYGPKNDK